MSYITLPKLGKIISASDVEGVTSLAKVVESYTIRFPVTSNDIFILSSIYTATVDILLLLKGHKEPIVYTSLDIPLSEKHHNLLDSALIKRLPESSEDKDNVSNQHFIRDRTSKILAFLAMKEREDAQNAALATGVHPDRVNNPVHVTVQGYDLTPSQPQRVSVVTDKDIKNFKLRVEKISKMVDDNATIHEKVELGEIKNIVPDYDPSLLEEVVGKELDKLANILNQG